VIITIITIVVVAEVVVLLTIMHKYHSPLVSSLILFLPNESWRILLLPNESWRFYYCRTNLNEFYYCQMNFDEFSSCLDSLRALSEWWVVSPVSSIWSLIAVNTWREAEAKGSDVSTTWDETLSIFLSLSRLSLQQLYRVRGIMEDCRLKNTRSTV
jgi:hypothetical protein